MMRAFIVGMALTLSLTSGCAFSRKKPPQPATADVKKELSRAEMEMNSGSTKRALGRLKKIAANHADTDAADDAFILLGNHYYKTGAYNDSYKAYITVIDSEFISPREVEAAIGAGKALFKLGRFDEALSLTGRALKEADLSTSTKIEIHSIRYVITQQTGDRLDTVRSLVFLAENHTDPVQKEKFRIRAIEIVDSGLKEEQLQVVAKEKEFTFLRGSALYRVGLNYFEQRDYSRAESYFRNLISILPGTDIAQNAESYLRQIEARRRVDPTVVGAILPLTGRHAGVAQRTLRGLELGLGIRGSRTTNLKLAIIDSEANPDIARRGVERLVVEDSAVAIVGDLLSRTAEPVAQKADELGVPIIGLSQKSRLTDIGENVFRNALTSEAIVQELVNAAINQYGMQRFAILYPNDNYGVEYANLFWDEVSRRGGQITSVQPYAPNETDFNGVISRLVGTFYLEDRAEEYSHLVKEWYGKQKVITSRVLPPSDLLPPIVDFDAVFVPDAVKALGQISSMLVYHDVKDVRLLGTNLWNTQSLIERGSQLIENSLFVEAENVVDSTFKRSTFFRDYVALYSEEPTTFDAQAYDVGLALRQIVEGGARSRAAVRDSLAGLRNLSGASGRVDVSESREFTRPLVVLTVKEGKIARAVPPPDASSN